MKRVISAALAAFLLVACGGGPHLESPPVVEGDFSAVSPSAITAVSTRDVWVVGALDRVSGGSDGLVLQSEDGGRRWRRIGYESGMMSGTRLTAVHVLDRHRAWVAGVKTVAGVSKAVVFRTEDSGNRFREIELPINPTVVPKDILDLKFDTDFNGSLSLISATGTGKWRTDDGGRSWTMDSWTTTAEAGAHRMVSIHPTRGYGFRLKASTRPGVTIVEESANQGKDWMPVSEIAVGYVSTW